MALSRKFGLIDLGTNSVRFDAHSIHETGETHLIHREKLMVRLGENVFLKHRLDRSAIHRTLLALGSFRATANALGLERIVAFATSAVRDARDGDRFCERVRSDLGIPLQVISGKEEAGLIAAGILSNRADKGKDFSLVDIGGGSMEVSQCEGGKVVRSHSFPLGVARLQQVHLKTSPPSARNLEATREHIQAILSPVLKDWPPTKRILGSSGTVRALTRVAKRKGTKLTLDGLSSLVTRIAPLTPDEIEWIPGMDPKRRDLILAGSLVLEECMRHLNARRVLATKYSLRDGMLQKILSELPQTRVPNPLDAARELAEKLSLPTERLGMALFLFSKLQAIHGLTSVWRERLALAFLFQDAGHRISAEQGRRHSAYIVRNADLYLKESEQEEVALLCLRASGEIKARWLLHLFHVLEPIASLAESIHIKQTNGALSILLPNHPSRELVHLRSTSCREECLEIFKRKLEFLNQPG